MPVYGNCQTKFLTMPDTICQLPQLDWRCQKVCRVVIN